MFYMTATTVQTTIQPLQVLLDADTKGMELRLLKRGLDREVWTKVWTGLVCLPGKTLKLVCQQGVSKSDSCHCLPGTPSAPGLYPTSFRGEGWNPAGLLTSRTCLLYLRRESVNPSNHHSHTGEYVLHTCEYVFIFLRLTGSVLVGRPQAETSQTGSTERLRSVRTEFVNRVSGPVLDSLLDRLLQWEVLNELEMETVKVIPERSHSHGAEEMSCFVFANENPSDWTGPLVMRNDWCPLKHYCSMRHWWAWPMMSVFNNTFGLHLLIILELGCKAYHFFLSFSIHVTAIDIVLSTLW